MLKAIEALVPAIVVLLGTVLVAFVFQYALSRPPHLVKSRAFLRGILLLLTVAAGALGFILALPINHALRIQLLTVLGIVLSAIITLSSTTFVGNAMAGFMLRALKRFSVGDYIRVENQAGRVSEMGIFHTEIQTEESNLVTLPNLHLVTQPVTVVRTWGSGTVISATVSLGYDVPRQKVERILTKAAAQAGLKEPFVQILELGDFSVTYRCAGLLTDTRKLVAARSLLRANMLDLMHASEVEIVSPTFLSHRVYPVERSFIPKTCEEVLSEDPALVPREDVLFDKAEKAASVEELRIHLEKLVKHEAKMCEALRKAEGEAQKEKYRKSIKRLKEYTEILEKRIEEAEKPDN